MHVLDHLELVLVDDSGALASQVEAQQRQQLVVERLCDANILDRDLDVVDDGLGHGVHSVLQRRILNARGPAVKLSRVSDAACVCNGYRQLQRKARAAVGAVAMGQKLAAELLGENRTRVQAESVAILLGREAELEQPR